MPDELAPPVESPDAPDAPDGPDAPDAPTAPRSAPSPRARRLRRAAIAMGVTSVLLAGAVAVAVPSVRAHARATIAARCAAVVGGTCEFGELRFERGGVVLRDVRFRNEATGTTGRAGQVAVQFRWWPLVRGAPQAATLRVEDVRVESPGSVDDLVAEYHRIQATRGRGTGRGGSVRVDTVAFTGLEFTGHAAVFFRVGVESASGEWRRDAGFTGGWSEASVAAGPFTAARTGACRVRREHGATRVALDCEGFAQSVEVDTAEGRMAAVRAIMAASRGPSRRLADVVGER